jgi:hypothetical protein
MKENFALAVNKLQGDNKMSLRQTQEGKNLKIMAVIRTL